MLNLCFGHTCHEKRVQNYYFFMKPPSFYPFFIKRDSYFFKLSKKSITFVVKKQKNNYAKEE